jgi:type IV pilus assembly protein PilB
MAVASPVQAGQQTNQPKQQTTLPGIARALVQAQILKPAQALDIQVKAETAERKFIDEMLASNVMNAVTLAKFCSTQFGLPLMDLDAFNQDWTPQNLVSIKLITQGFLIPLAKRGNKITIAVSDPTDQSILDRIQFETECQIEVVVTEHDKLRKILEKLAKSAGQQLSEFSDGVDDLEFANDDPNASPNADTDVDDAPIVKFLQKILIDAIESGASDIHFEPYEKFYRIRYRVDGELKEIMQPPNQIKDKLASRIKVISRLDISEKRVPQDGRMKIVLSATKAIDFRVSTLPTLFGEKIVMRILDPSSAKLGIDALGYEADQKAVLMEAVQRPYGMVLVTGPTGSGKTVSLYTCLNILNKPGINISTAEDPAEINLPGINQVNVNDRAGLSFSVALKSFLRQDPDVIMVGEIRDLETADISIKAAQTGHMVMSTLHTNDAPTTLTRMMNMGIAPFNIASSVILITAQRLARRLCTCKEVLEMTDEALIEVGYKPEDLDGTWKPYKPVGCDRCGGGGYKGRVGIYQVMPITEEIQKIILSNGNAMQIAEQARREGVSDLRQSGLRKVKSGQTSIEEVLGCTNE